ncbi:MAG TPA: YkgJ family cysteine cluster protein [Steroidobacteraceae bacterium]|nr:YkgJ family cysteine cluster protein [Steroidobacteraceae bacterium]
MEIILDDVLVHGIVTQETQRARADIERLGPVAAYESSRTRHDARLSAAPDAHTLACKSGCFWCCYFTVDVRAVEAFSILDFMARELSAEEQARVRSEIEANSAALRGLSELERMQRNVKCPFLAQGRCSIYEARPQTCRNYHATDVTGCRASYEHPADTEIDPDFAPLVYQSGGAHVDAFCSALEERGYDTRAYELSTALAAAIAQPEARARFEAKESPFPTLAGTDVPPEFLDTD